MPVSSYTREQPRPCILNQLPTFKTEKHGHRCQNSCTQSAKNRRRSSEHCLPLGRPPPTLRLGLGSSLLPSLPSPGVLACQPSAGTTGLTSPLCLAWLCGAPWPPTEISVVPLSSATDEINSSRASRAGWAGSAHGVD